MKNIRRKLISEQAETLAELLAAALILAFGLMMLASAMLASARIMERSEERLQDYYEDSELSGSGELVPAVLTVLEDDERKNLASPHPDEEEGSYPIRIYSEIRKDEENEEADE